MGETFGIVGLECVEEGAGVCERGLGGSAGVGY